jgi:ATP-dependent exoDNAse (exonuclease V) alpha subunit
MTYHQFLRINDADDHASWNPAEKLGPSIAQHDAVIWDEIGCVPPELLRKATAFLVRSGVQVVLCGDPLGQVQAIGDDQSGEHIMQVIEDLGARVRRFTTDHRAKNCPRLQAAKQRAWCASTEEQAAALEQVAQKCTRIEMLEQLYRPGDLVLATANEVVDDLRKQMAAVVPGRFPNAPMHLTFRPKNAKLYKKKGGKIPMVALPTGAMVEAIIGSIHEVPASTTYDASLWQAGSASTVHAVQGQTIKAPRRIFICMDRVRTQHSERGDWAKNALYVAMSRAESAEQLYYFWKK